MHNSVKFQIQAQHVSGNRYYLVFTQQLQQVPLPAAAISNNISQSNKVSGSGTTPIKTPKDTHPQSRPAYALNQTDVKPQNSFQSPLDSQAAHLNSKPLPFPNLDDASMLEHWSTRAPSVPPPSTSTSLPSPSSPPSSSTRSSPSPSPAHLSNPGGPLLVSLAELAMLPPHAPPNKVGIMIITMSVFFLVGVTRTYNRKII